MRKLYFALPLLALIPLAAACALSQPSNRSASGEPATVDAVDLTRYAGTWYEIARYPNSFEKNCIETKATYGLNEDGTVSVVNASQAVAYRSIGPVDQLKPEKAAAAAHHKPLVLRLRSG